MTATIYTLLLLLAVMIVVAIVARRLKTAPSILLVIAGIGLALTPGIPAIELDPQFVLFGILPPLVYAAAVAMSWREFRANLRPIAFLAFGCVLFTAAAVAVVAHFLFAMPLAVGFVLGAIVAPPDPVAPLAIVRQLGVPRRIMVVLEAEGTANDATSLILYRFAVATVGTGLFSLPAAAATFAVIVVGEIGYGIFIGWASLRLRRWARDPRVEITLSLMTPFAAFLVPANLGGSGVLATIACGLFVSWNGPLLIPAATRLQGIFFWDLLIYLLEGLIFLVTGLQMRTLLDRMGSVLSGPIVAVLVVFAVVVVTRFIWVYPAAYLPRWLSKTVARRDPLPPWQFIFFLALVGMRGVVSLAAALALPLTTSAGTPFPYRDFILFVTFGLIVLTVVGEGALLPSVTRWLGLPQHATAEREREHDAELAARSQALEKAQSRLQELAASGAIAPEVMAILRARHHYRFGRFPRSAMEGAETAAAAADIRIELIAAERDYIYRLLQQGQITDEARRRLERDLDLEEASIALNREESLGPPL
jgi:monovalent cation/hydrogen antiporter